MRHYRQMRHILQQEYRQKRLQTTRLQRKQRRFSLPLACMGAMCSAIAGGLFYHTILAGLGSVESLVLAILFPLVVTGTFVSSEIHKDAQENAIREGFGGGDLTETAIRAETKLTSALAVHEHVLAYLEKPEAEQAIEDGAKHLLSDILAELRGSSPLATGHIIITEETTDPMTRQLAPTSEQDEATAFSVPHTTPNTTRPPVASQEESDTTSADRKPIDDTPAHDSTTTGNTTMARKEATSDTTSEAEGSEEQDPVTRQIFAYLAQHPHAKQATVAEALGIAVRTVQRKLAAWKRQQSSS
ncbi:MAG TPA: hypothetical protein VFN35_34975 [Ktedonobacteraceae bacterium]|nr:hypothetical protein [Ktedonobacteraceae bacterium]